MKIDRYKREDGDVQGGEGEVREGSKRMRGGVLVSNIFMKCSARLWYYSSYCYKFVTSLISIA